MSYVTLLYSFINLHLNDVTYIYIYKVTNII